MTKDISLEDEQEAQAQADYFDEITKQPFEIVTEEVEGIIKTSEKMNLVDEALNRFGAIFGFNNCLYQCIKIMQMIRQLKNMKRSVMNPEVLEAYDMFINMLEDSKK